MKTSINHYFNHFLRLVNLNTPQGRRRELEDTIESLDVELRLHGLGDEAPKYRDKLVEAQREYYKRYGEHYKFGTFEIKRRQKEIGVGRKIA